MILDDILEEIKKAKNIVILTHENPDGDAMGSCLAMYNALEQIGKEVDVIVPVFARTYNFLTNSEKVKIESEKFYDLAIALDCSDIKRLVGFEKYYEEAKVKVQIDHHGVNSMYGDYNYVDPVSPACAQILVNVLQYWNIDINKEIGTCLLAGIITDTGGFRHSNINSETFEFVSWILNKGVNVSNVYRQVLQKISKTKFELSKLASERIEFLEDGKIAFTYITEEDEKNLNCEVGDHEGIVERGRDIEGVEVSIFLREDKKGYKVSLRSNDYVNVSDVCLIFGGGGHVKAAGCHLPCSLLQAKQKIIEQVKLYLK